MTATAERERLLQAILSAGAFVLRADDADNSILRLADAILQSTTHLQAVWYGVGRLGASTVEPRQIVGPQAGALQDHHLRLVDLKPWGTAAFRMDATRLPPGVGQVAIALPVDFTEGHWRGWLVLFADDPVWLEAIGITPFLALARFAEVVAEQARLRLQLENAAMRDPLSGLLNRRAMLARIQAAMELAAEGGETLALALFDIDHFKKINDQHGHDVGDEAIRTVAQALRSTVRDADTVARWGGEEFLVLLEHSPPSAAARAAERLRTAIGQARVVLGPVSLSLTSSVGVAAWPLDGNSVDELLKVADERLYQAKQGGRNRVVCGPEPEWAHGPQAGASGDLAKASRVRISDPIAEPVRERLVGQRGGADPFGLKVPPSGV